MNWLLFFFAIVAGGLFLAFSPHPEPVGDAKDYFESAQSLFPYLFWKDNPHEHLIMNMTRAPLYITCLAVFYQMFSGLGDNAVVWVIRIVQLGFYAANIVLIYQNTSILLKSNKWALTAAFLGLFYMPFLFITDRLLTETLMITVLLYLLLFWMLKKPFWCGFFLFLLLGLKLILPWPIVLIGFLGTAGIGFWQRPHELGSQIYKISIPILVGSLIMCFVSIPFAGGREQLSSIQMFAWDFADTLGWDSLVPIHGKLSLLSAQNNPSVLPGFIPTGLEPQLKWFVTNPEQFITLFLANVYRFFIFPENTYLHSWFFISPGLIQVYHFVLIAIFILSVPVTWQNKNTRLLSLPALILCLYSATSHIESRYNLIIMPFVILADTFALCFFLKHRRIFSKLWLMSVLAFIVVMVLWVGGFLYPFILYWGAVTPATFRILGLLIGLIGIAYYFSTLFKFVTAADDSQKKQRSVLSSGFLGFLLGIVIILPIFSDQVILPRLEEWQATLRDNNAIEKVISLKPEFFEPTEMVTYLLIDMTPSIDSAPSIHVSVNGIRVNTFYQPPAGLNQLNFLLAAMIRSQDLLQYRWYRLPDLVMKSIQETGSAKIQIQKRPEASVLRVKGDYPEKLNSKGARYWIPSPDWGLFSVFKTAFDRDGRLPAQVEEGMPVNLSKDLSSSPGIQSGQYRIFLYRLKPSDAHMPDFPRPMLYQTSEGLLMKDFRLAY